MQPLIRMLQGGTKQQSYMLRKSTHFGRDGSELSRKAGNGLGGGGNHCSVGSYGARSHPLQMPPPDLEVIGDITIGCMQKVARLFSL